MRKISVYWVTCVLAVLMFVAPAKATTIVMPNDAQLVAKSPLIIEGVVVSSAPVDRNGAIWTESVIRVERALKGNASGDIVVREIGGMIGNRITKIFGAPEYTPGERVMAFLTPTPRGDYQTVDLFVGKFAEERMVNGARLWSRHDEAADVSLLDHDFHPINERNVQRDADAFETFVRDRVAGRTGATNYGIENPVLERDIKPPSNGASKIDNFTLLSEPNIYRWFTFEQGGSARWYSYGAQNGYSGGGVSEVQTAMSVWDGYTSAKINYVYGGAGSGSPAGLQNPNGINEILFNDPLNEISGSWNQQTGGVVGLGGFNGVTNGPNWTAPFTADASHTQRTYSTSNISEGNLTIQDNVSASTGVPSATLAEIIAHELGHTLGLGHSSDSSALMYATISPGGASLRPDDQVAARWLYPSGAQTPNPTPTIPSAPANLSGSASSSQIALQWNDTSSNESGFYVYVASNGGFSRTAQLGAGATSTTLSGLAAGSYRFYVTSFNSAGESAASNTITVTVAAPAPQLTAAFNVSPASGTAGSTVFSFTDQSSGTITSRTWNLGDGSTSSTATASHVFASAGQYTVVLTVSNGSATSQTSRVVSVAAPLPVYPTVNAYFTMSLSSPRAGDSIAFNDASSGSPTAWSWSFGDGATSHAQSPTHMFATAGTFLVTLTASNGGSSSTISRATVVGNAVTTYRSLVSVTAQTNGAGGSVWRTELTLFNAGIEGATVQLIFIPSAGGAMQTRSRYLSPRESATFANALLDLFNMPSGAGAIAIEATSAGSTPNLKISSRTFTTGSSGTYGQSVPSVDGGDMMQTLIVPGIESDADYRTNIGLVNRSSSSLDARLMLFTADGVYVGTRDVTIAATSFQQASLASYFPAASGHSYDRLTLSVTTASTNALSAYASVIDNRTQDPVYIQGAPYAQPSNRALVIPAVGRLSGGNGTYWRSDVTMMNPRGDALAVTLRYLLSGGDNRNAASRNYSIAAGRALVLRDILSTFGLSSGSGALEISWNVDGGGPSVTSRTYTTVDGGGTYGQSIDPVQSFNYDSIVPGLRSDSSFRSNIGFVNGGDAPISIGVLLLSSSGQEVASASVALQPRSQMQTSLSALFPSVNTSLLGSCTLQAHTNNAPTLFMYGSIVDNASGDPVFYAGE